MTYVKSWPPGDAKLEWRFRLRVQGKAMSMPRIAATSNKER